MASRSAATIARTMRWVGRRAPAAGIAALCGIFGLSRHAAAQEDPLPEDEQERPAAPQAPPPPAPPQALTPPPLVPPAPPGDGGATPKLSPIDYDGRTEPTTAGDVFIWVPRVLFFPVYLVAEYVIRAPLGAFVRFLEAHKVVQKAADILTFGPERNIGVVPTFLIDFGFTPSVGAYAWWDKFLWPENALRVHVATGGADYVRSTVTDRITMDEHSQVRLRFEGIFRPDYVFYGLGPRALEANRSRYRQTSFEGTIGFAAHEGTVATLDVYASVKYAHFSWDGFYADDPSLGTLVLLRRLDLPPGFGGYTALRDGLRGALDSRSQRPSPGSGARVEANVEHDLDLRTPATGRWLRWGGAVGGFLDLTGTNRVIGLSVAAQFADPLGEDPVPFTELATLGGDFAPMRGFLEGRLYDRSAIAATLEYRWPIWSFLDGSAQAAVGNVFGRHLEDFAPDLLRVSFAVGVRSTASRDHSFDIMVGSGTETFRDGAKLNDFRFVFGASRGF